MKKKMETRSTVYVLLWYESRMRLGSVAVDKRFLSELLMFLRILKNCEVCGVLGAGNEFRAAIYGTKSCLWDVANYFALLVRALLPRPPGTF